MQRIIKLKKGAYKLLQRIYQRYTNQVFVASKLKNQNQEYSTQCFDKTEENKKEDMSAPDREENNMICKKKQKQQKEENSIEVILQSNQKKQELQKNRKNSEKEQILFSEKFIVKIIKCHHKDSSFLALLKDYLTEIKMLRCLSHPSILPLLDYGYISDSSCIQFCLVTKYCSKGNLKDLMDDINLCEQIVLLQKDKIKQHFIYSIAGIIKFLDQNGVIHRDIKLQNFVIDDEFQLKIIDFGSAQVIDEVKFPIFDESFDSELLNYIKEINQNPYVKKAKPQRNSTPIGTNYYISPEMIEQYRIKHSNLAYYSKVDVWSFGVLVFYLLSGFFPFQGNSFQISQKVKNKKVNLIHFPKIIVHQMLSQLLEKQPSQRASAANFEKMDYFKNVNFEQISLLQSPLPEIYKMLQKKSGSPKVQQIKFDREADIFLGNIKYRRRIRLVKQQIQRDISQSKTQKQMQLRIRQYQENSQIQNQQYLNENADNPHLQVKHLSEKTKESSSRNTIKSDQSLKPKNEIILISSSLRSRFSRKIAVITEQIILSLSPDLNKVKLTNKKSQESICILKFLSQQDKFDFIEAIKQFEN